MLAGNISWWTMTVTLLIFQENSVNATSYKYSFWKKEKSVTSLSLEQSFTLPIKSKSDAIRCFMVCLTEGCKLVKTELGNGLCTGYTNPSNTTTSLDSSMEMFYRTNDICMTDGYTLDIGHYICYKVHYAKKNWTDSVSVCNAEGGELLIVDTYVQFQFWSSMVINTTADQRFWIGGSDIEEEGQWKWWNEEHMPMGDAFWWSLEPNNNYGIEHCAGFLNEKFNDFPCENVYAFICQRSLN